jgi:RNA polymerase sigma-70 factor (ECF subfamily)
LQNAGPGEITQLLGRWEQGGPGVMDSLAPLVYDQLRAIAEAFLRNERPDHTLQPTAVVNEVFVDLLRLRRLAINDRAQFFAFAAQVTRRVLIDSARKAKAGKRGGRWTRIPLEAERAWLSNENAESLDLSDVRSGEIIEWRDRSRSLLKYWGWKRGYSIQPCRKCWSRAG